MGAGREAGRCTFGILVLSFRCPVLLRDRPASAFGREHLRVARYSCLAGPGSAHLARARLGGHPCDTSAPRPGMELMADANRQYTIDRGAAAFVHVGAAAWLCARRLSGIFSASARNGRGGASILW